MVPNVKHFKKFHLISVSFSNHFGYGLQLSNISSLKMYDLANINQSGETPNSIMIKRKITLTNVTILNHEVQVSKTILEKIHTPNSAVVCKS